MDEEEDVRSVIPVEETIIDPLYEPLKLNRYKLCPHLQRLKDVSHLRYGLSPYLLFDVEGMKEVITAISKDMELGEGLKERCKKFLNYYYTKFSKDFGEYLKNFENGPQENETKNAYYKRLRLNRNGLLEKFKETKEEYRKIIEGDLFIDEEFREENLNKEAILERLKEKLNTKGIPYSETIRIEEEKPNKWIITDKEKKNTYVLKKEYGNLKIYLEGFLYSSSQEFNKDNFAKISYFFHLEYPVKVKCPICEKEQFMCEEGKIYSLKEALLRTFELRRSRWLYLSGVLHTIHRASTHTRLSHQIGSLIVGVNALYEMDVYSHKDMSMWLGEYLLMRGELYEFLMANFLHDIGHPPLSHVLEPNPFIELDHEKITMNLIHGEKTEKEEGMDWYVTERYLLKMKAIKDFKHRFFENKYDPIYHINYNEGTGEEFLNHLDDNNEILESEIVTVSEVLDNFDINKKRVVEILTGKIFCPKCDTLSKIEGDKVKCEKCGKKVEIEKEKSYDIQFLNKLIDSEIDFDRIDHVKRDSVVCGLSLISFRLLELVGGMSVVLPESDVHKKETHGREENKPYIFISEGGLLYVMDLLTARRSVFRDILYSDENNWINGVVNQITALAVRYLPHLTNMLPFITDPILAHFYMNELFLGTQIEKLNKLFHGKIDCSAYGKPMRYKLRNGVSVTKEDLRGMYRVIEGINDEQEYEKLELPAVVFYTNIKPMKCPVCEKRNLKRMDKDNYKCANCASKIAIIESKKWGITITNEKYKNVLSKEDRKKLDTCEIVCKEVNEVKGGENGNVVVTCDVEPRKETWGDIFVYGKKFTIEKDTENLKYFKFKELAGEYSGTSRERFPKRPSELDVKNLFYVWVSDFCDERKILEIIKRKIEIGEKGFDDMFVDLDDKEGF